MNKLLIFCVYFLHMYCIYCFNIDTENTLFFTGNSGSEFGFTSGMMENGQGKWLLVGSPKDNFTDRPEIISPGNVYKCPISISTKEQNGCVPLTLRSGESSRASNDYPYEQTKELLGSNLLITNDAVVICASLWKYLVHAVDIGLEYPIGYCYQVDRNLQSVTNRFYSSLTDTSNLYNRDGYIFANSMIGIASTATEIPSNGVILGAPGVRVRTKIPSYGVILGAPGVIDGMGGYILYKPNDFGADSFYTAVRADSDATISSSFVRRRGSYIGYSIASGRFGPTSTPLVVTGAPHYSNENGHIGAVLLSEFTGNFLTRKVLQGDTIGAQFGASLVIADVNGDGTADLMIGSPLDSQQEIDQGKVDVYHGTGDSNYITKISELRGLGKSGSRFGTCMATLGDITDDGYTDIAIGAPFEDDEIGAVYIFNGGPNGLQTQYSQRISGQDVKSGLKSFGYHISSGLDVDNNQYEDLAVGAFMSDTTVILRTRPTVRLTATLSISTTVIPLNSSGLSCMGSDVKPCAELQICFTYTGRGVNNGIFVDYELKTDTERTAEKKSSRLHLYDLNVDQGDSFRNKSFFIPAPSTQTCITHIGRTLILSKDFYRAIEEDVRFELNFELSNSTLPGELLPILASDNNRMTNVTARFEKECENSCRPNLKIDMQLGSRNVIIGETDELIAIIDLENFGDPSYTTSILVTTSNNTIFLGSQVVQGSEAVECQSVVNVTNENILCEVVTPFRANSMVRFSLRLGTPRSRLLPSTDDIDNILPHVHIKSHVIPTATGSTEVDFSDNTKTLQIPVNLKSSAEISGTSQPEQKIVTNIMSYVKHNYGIYNRGPSPLPPTSLIITIPVRPIQGIAFVQEQNILVSDSLSCALSYPSSDATIPVTMPTTSMAATTKLSTSQHTSSASENTTTTTSQYTTTTASTTTTSFLPPLARSSGTERNLTCDNYLCATLNCSVPVIDVSTEFPVEVSILVVEAGLPFNVTDILVRYGTKSWLHPPSHPLIVDPWMDPIMFQVFTQFLISNAGDATTALNVWILIGGCAGGIVLFIIVGLVLWKVGFFKREKQEEVKKYKRMSNLQQKRRTQLAAARQTLGMAGECPYATLE